MRLNYGGFVPLSLSDYPGKPAAVLFMRGCKYKCPYCHNKDICRGTFNMSVDRVMETIKAHRRGIRALVISGGEPLLQPAAIEEICRKRDDALCVGIETAGVDPDALERLLKTSLVDYVMLDVKAHNEEEYTRITGDSKAFWNMRCCLDVCATHQVKVQCRTTVYQGYPSADQIEEIRKMITQFGFSDLKIQEAIV